MRQAALPHLERLAGARIVVTGAGGGIGEGIATACHRAGARVVLVTRTEVAGEQAAARIADGPGGPERPAVAACDLACQDEVAALARRLCDDGPVDVLFANAGVQPWRRTHGPDGCELTFATNVLSVWLLVRGLAPALSASRLKAVVATGSMVHRWGRIDWDDLEAARAYDPQQVYARSKAALLLVQTGLRPWLARSGISMHTLEPGMTRTRFARHFEGFDAVMARVWQLFMREPDAVGREFAAFAARPDLSALAEPVWFRGRPVRPAPFAIDAADAARMLAACERRVAGPAAGAPSIPS